VTEYPRLVAGLALACGSRAAAEDAVQEAMARAWERGERGERIESLKAWVTTVALNVTRSGFRRLRAERRARGRLGSGSPSHAIDSEGEVGTIAAVTDTIDVRRALALLSRRQRQATVLRYYLDMDVAEVAAAMRISEGAAKTTLFRARGALASALGEHEPEEANDVAEP
jgi:RNA polymerase sigma-70 factor, ECF subfamily